MKKLLLTCTMLLTLGHAIRFGAIALSALLTHPAALSASDRDVTQRGAERGRLVKPAILDIDLRDLPLAKEWEPGDPIIEIPRRVTHPPRVRPQARPQPQVDPLLQRQTDAVADVVDLGFPDPIVSFEGHGFTGSLPPDTVGDVSRRHYIQAVNHPNGSSAIVYNKRGSVLAGPFNMDTLGTGGACADGHGDPIVLYDALADRWLLSEFSLVSNNLCVYISRTSDPISGGWFRYQFTAPNFPDYPKYAVWPDAYYVSTNENNPAAYALDRHRMLQGLSATFQRFTAPDLPAFPFQALTPADLDGTALPPVGAPGIFMRHRDDEVHNPPGTAQDFLEIWEFHVDWQNPGNSTFTGPTNIEITDFSSELCGLEEFRCFPQPGTPIRLDPLREVVMFRLQYRNFGTHQSLAGNFVTDADGEPDTPPHNERGGIRWFELRKSADSNWGLFQEGTYSPDRNNRWMGSAAMDRFGNFAVGYSVSSERTFPGIRYAGRLASDPPGTLPQGEATLRNGSFSQNGIRWGDYAAMSVDPLDDCTFWFTTEYMPTPNWGTRIGSFQFDACRLGAQFCLKFVHFCDGIQVNSIVGDRINAEWYHYDCANNQPFTSGRKAEPCTFSSPCGGCGNGLISCVNCDGVGDFYFLIDIPPDGTLDKGNGVYPGGSCFNDDLLYNLFSGPCVGLEQRGGEPAQIQDRSTVQQ